MSASWNISAVNITLDIDWDRLGLHKRQAVAPLLTSFNRAKAEHL